MDPTHATRTRLYLGLIVLLGVALRIYHMALYPFWRDEAFTRYLGAEPLSYLWTTAFRLETNPPGYYTLIHEWMRLFGTSEAALRSLSVLASSLTIPIVYVLGRTLANVRVGLIAALIFALSPIEIWYAQDARTYALLQLPLALSLLGLAQFMARPAAVAPLVLYALGAIAAVYCHNSVAVVIASCNLAVIAAAWGPRACLKWRDLIPWLLANGVVGLATLPTVLISAHQAGSSNISWIPPLRYHALNNCFSEFLFGQAPLANWLRINPWFFLFAAIVALAARWRGGMDRRTLSILVVAPLVFITLVMILSLWQSMLTSKAFVWMWIPLSVLLALLMEHRAGPCWVALALTIVVFGVGLEAYYFPREGLKEDWRDLSALGPGWDSPSALLVLNMKISVGPLAYYHPEVLPRLRFLREKGTVPEFIDAYYGEHFHVPALDEDELRAEINASRPVYLISSLGVDLEICMPRSLPAPARDSDVALAHARVKILTWNPPGSPPATLHSSN